MSTPVQIRCLRVISFHTNGFSSVSFLLKICMTRVDLGGVVTLQRICCRWGSQHRCPYAFDVATCREGWWFC